MAKKCNVKACCLSEHLAGHWTFKKTQDGEMWGLFLLKVTI